MSRRGQKAPSTRPPSIALGAFLFGGIVRARSSRKDSFREGFALCRLRLGNEDTVGITIFPNRIDADVTLLVQRVFDHFRSEDYAVPGQAEPVRFYRLAWNRMAVLVVTTRPRIP